MIMNINNISFNGTIIILNNSTINFKLLLKNSYNNSNWINKYYKKFKHVQILSIGSYQREYKSAGSEWFYNSTKYEQGLLAGTANLVTTWNALDSNPTRQSEWWSYVII